MWIELHISDGSFERNCAKNIGFKTKICCTTNEWHITRDPTISQGSLKVVHSKIDSHRAQKYFHQHQQHHLPVVFASRIIRLLMSASRTFSAITYCSFAMLPIWTRAKTTAPSIVPLQHYFYSLSLHLFSFKIVRFDHMISAFIFSSRQVCC